MQVHPINSRKMTA